MNDMRWRIGDWVETRAGNIYRIEELRNPTRFGGNEWTYRAKRFRDGKFNEHSFVMAEQSFVRLATDENLKAAGFKSGRG
jgi:hypothetical protein